MFHSGGAGDSGGRKSPKRLLHHELTLVQTLLLQNSYKPHAQIIKAD